MFLEGQGIVNQYQNKLRAKIGVLSLAQLAATADFAVR